MIKSHFARYGVPLVIVSDNGPQFASTLFRNFARCWNFKHQTISPGNSQANGAAEAAVKIVKRILRKSAGTGDDPQEGLLNYHNTPTEGMNTSPSQRMFGRRTRALLPMTQTMLNPTSFSTQEESFLKVLKRQKTVGQGRGLPILSPGDTVRMQPIDGRKEWREAMVVRPMSTRAYEVSVGDKTYIRNRRHFRAAQKSSHSQVGSHCQIDPQLQNGVPCVADEREKINRSDGDRGPQPESSGGMDGTVGDNNAALQPANVVPGSPKRSPARHTQTPAKTRSGRIPKLKQDPEFVYQKP